MKSIIDFLSKKNLLNEEQIAELNTISESKNFFLYLEKKGIIQSEENLYKLIALDLNVPFLAKLDQLPKNIESLIPGEIAIKYKAIPIKEDLNGLHIALLDPFQSESIENIRFLLEKEIVLVVSPFHLLQEKIEQYYGESKSQENNSIDTINSPIETKSNHEELGDSGIIQYVNSILEIAVKEKAADIHFEPFENEFKIRYRVDGALLETQAPPIELASAISSRIKVMANMDIAETRLPQDGRILEKMNGSEIEFRVSSIPTQYGESVVLRVLDSSGGHATLDNIGLPNKIYEDIESLVKSPNGIFIVTGPTGSGKTTTLYSALKKINKIDKKILTIEDPVEYEIEGIIQLSTHEEIELTFSKALRSFLRQDPDCIMVGEMRDIDTVNTAIQASLTGHLVFSTLHTNDAASSITRLIDIGAEPFLVANSLRGILAQRLVRKICPHCKTSYEPNEDILNQLGISANELGEKNFYTGKGCDQCHQTGYLGRQGLFELLIVNEEIAELITQEAPSIVLKEKATKMGMLTLREDGLRNIYNGITTIEEVLKYT